MAGQRARRRKVRSRPFWSVILGSKRAQGVAYFSARFFGEELAPSVAYIVLALPCCNIPRHFCGRAPNGARTEQSQRTPGVMVSAGLCGNRNATAGGAVLYRRFVQDRQRRLLSHFGGQLRASDVAHSSASDATWQEDNAPSHRSEGHEGFFSKVALKGHCPFMLLARRSVRSKIAFSSVSMPTEAISRHDFLQMLHSWCESNKNCINPNHFEQRSTLAAARI